MVKSPVVWFLAVLVLAGFVAGCDKLNEPENESPVIPQLHFSSPVQPSTVDTCQYPAWMYAQVINEFAMMPSYFSLTAAQRDGDTWTYVVPQGTVTMTLTAVKQSNGDFTWSLMINGTEDSTTYNNWVAMQGTTSADGSSGSLTFYEENTTTVEGQFTWTTNSSNVLTGTLIMYSSGTPEVKLVEVSNPDTSGEITVSMYSSGTWIPTFHATWQAGAPAICD